MHVCTYIQSGQKSGDGKVGFPSKKSSKTLSEKESDAYTDHWSVQDINQLQKSLGPNQTYQSLISFERSLRGGAIRVQERAREDSAEKTPV